MLIDGQRVNNASGGAAPLEYLSVEQIERVEVSRGANSVIYGSEAMGGVIQIFTRRGQSEGLQPRVRMAYGNRSTWERSTGLSGGNGATRFSLNASAEDTDGTNRTDAEQGPNSDHDAYRNNGLSLNLSHRFSEDVEAGLSLLDQRGETEYDLGYMGSYPYDEFELKSYASYLAAQINDTWNSRLELGHSESRRFFRADDSTAKDSLSTYRDTVNWLNDLRLNAEHSLTLGAEWYEDSLNSNTAYAEDRRWNKAAYVQHRFSGEHFSTELGVRHDDNEQFGHENSWRGALTLPLDTRNQLVFSYSEGFRAPTFMDLYYPYGANPDLQPERSKSYEVQWRSQLAERTRLEASIYRTDIEDAIVLDSSWTPMNISEARINGFEAALSHELMGWHGELGVSVIDPRDRDTGKTLSRRARRTLSLDLDRQFGAVSVVPAGAPSAVPTATRPIRANWPAMAYSACAAAGRSATRSNWAEGRQPAGQALRAGPGHRLLELPERRARLRRGGPHGAAFRDLDAVALNRRRAVCGPFVWRGRECTLAPLSIPGLAVCCAI